MFDRIDLSLFIVIRGGMSLHVHHLFVVLQKNTWSGIDIFRISPERVILRHGTLKIAAAHRVHIPPDLISDQMGFPL